MTKDNKYPLAKCHRRRFFYGSIQSRETTRSQEHLSWPKAYQGLEWEIGRMIMFVYMTDQEVTLQLRVGDKKALNWLFDQYYKPLVRYALKITSDAEASEEIVQDVFISVWKNRKSSRITSFKPYLTRAVKNRCINYINTNCPIHEHVDHHLQVVSDMSTDQPFRLEELSKALEAARKQLPQQTELIFSLSRHTEMTYEEISRELNVSVKTVEYHISKAIRSIRAFLDLHGFTLFVGTFVFF